jgi:hypothetical protein
MFYTISFFLNILVLNTDQVIEQQVAEKFEGYPRLARVMGEYAKAQVSEELVADQLAHKVAAAVPEAMKQLGIDATVRRRFISGAFLVLHVAINESHSEGYIESQVGSERGAYVESWLKRLGMKNYLERSNTDRVEHKLIHTLPAELKTKLAEIGIKVQIVAKYDADESHFFFGVVNDESEEMELEFGRSMQAALG